MKKIFALLFALLALTALLTGCRGGNTPAVTVTTAATTQPTTVATTEATTAATTQNTTDPTVDSGNGPLETTQSTDNTTAPAAGQQGRQEKWPSPAGKGHLTYKNVTYRWSAAFWRSTSFWTAAPSSVPSRFQLRVTIGPAQ